MTDQPDTAAIRATPLDAPKIQLRRYVAALCDALDAARAERDAIDAHNLAVDCGVMTHRSRELIERCRSEEWKARAEAAEARIAAALEEECRRPHVEGCCGCPVHAALAAGGGA